ncbi:MAG: ATP-binding cassette domain-containing protein [Gemmatimonadota bacterium]
MQGGRQPDGPSADPVVAFRSVSLRLGGTPVLRDLSFPVERGEILVLVGRSGAGKTSVLRLVNRLLEPDDGRVLVEGRDTLEWDPIELRRRIGYILQGVGLLPHLTVGENVELVPDLLGWDEARRRERSGELLEVVGLPPGTYADRYPRELSGGQKQRVGVARALAADPPLLLCDEPFGALDPITRRGLQEEFVELARRLGTTLLFVTHDLREAVTVGDRIGLLEDGGLAFLGTARAFRESDHPLVREFLGSRPG